MDKKVYLRHFQSFYDTYLDILTEYRDKNGYFLNKKESQLHTVPFILTTASALECTLNDHIIEFYYKNYNEENAKLLTKGLLSMSLRGKLENIISILTFNKYIINTNHKVYQILIELIKTRNNLVHNKSDFEIYEAYIKEDNENNISIDIDENFSDKIDNKLNSKIDYSLGIKRDIGEYHDALEKLFELFFNIYEDENFLGNKLVLQLKLKNNITFNVIN